jgi:hypothetical protein
MDQPVRGILQDFCKIPYLSLDTWIILKITKAVMSEIGRQVKPGCCGIIKWFG